MITPVCDGDTRPQSKQQSHLNRANREKSKCDAILARQDLRLLSKKADPCEQDLLKQRELEQKIKTAETKSVNFVPPNFPMLLEEALSKISAHDIDPESGGYVSTVLTAEFEADALMKGRHLESKCNLIMSTDADIPTDLGRSCIVINSFTGKDLKIATTSEATMDQAISCLIPESKIAVRKMKPPYPIYERIKSMKLRALVSVLLGSDVCPGGVKGIGTKKVFVKFDQLCQSIFSGETQMAAFCGENNDDNEDALFCMLMEYGIEASKSKAASSLNFNRDVIRTYVDVILCQPTNELIAGSQQKDQRQYLMQKPPVRLPKYLEEFRDERTEISRGPSMLKCKGSCGGSSHNFLSAVKHHQCGSANRLSVICVLQ